MDLTENADIAALTTFKVGGSARFLLRGSSVSDIEEAKRFAQDKQLPLIVLGGGSNILVDDGMANAVFFLPHNLGIDIKTNDKVALLSASAGESWDKVVAHATENKLFGIENLSGIPGKVGGAVVQNIGAYGAALSNTLREVEVFDFKENRIKILGRDACEFGYRLSLFKKEPARYVIVTATFELMREGRVDTSYRDLLEIFGQKAPEVSEVREAVLSIRARKFPDLTLEGTAGSFFKNPIVSKTDAQVLKQRFPDVPLYMIPEEEGVKVPLAWFMDKVLNLKGFSIGPVRCFEKQPLVIVAKSGATAADVRTLAHHVMTLVQKEIGIDITPEVCVLKQNSVTS